MRAEEKAKELYNKMLQWQYESFEYKKRNIISKSAKQCALIAVEEIISTVNMCIPYLSEGTYVKYWQEVKKEIELL
jgi:vacuolar-type H+-ATPase subunit H